MTLLIIDSNGLAYRAKHTTGNLSNGVVYGFLRAVLSLGEQFHTNRFLFCWDSKQSHRRRKHPWYKLKRRQRRQEKTPEEQAADNAAYKQFKELRCSVLPSMGFANVFMKTGFESDDLMAQLVNQEWSEHREDGGIVMITNDEDMFQTLPLCKIYNPVKKELYDSHSFTVEREIHPIEWARVKAIAGCSTDSVPGVPGVGESVAIDYLWGRLKPGSKRLTSIESHSELIERNRWLVELPLEGTPSLKIEEDDFDWIKFARICKRYQMNSFLKMRDRWKQFFKGEFDD